MGPVCLNFYPENGVKTANRVKHTLYVLFWQYRAVIDKNCLIYDVRIRLVGFIAYPPPVFLLRSGINSIQLCDLQICVISYTKEVNADMNFMNKFSGGFPF